MLSWIRKLGAAKVADTVAITVAVALAIALGVTLVTTDAGAVGGLLPAPGDPTPLVGVRYAVAVSPAQTTRWASLRFEHFPGAIAWVLPVRPGARIEQVGDAWLESLDLATAPRVVESGCAADAGPLRVRTERSAGHQAAVDALQVRAIEDPVELRATANAWALSIPADVEDRVAILHERGFRFVVLLYGASADRKVTRTVRVTDDSFPAVPLLLTAAPSNRAVEVTAFLVGATRARVGSGVEREIDPRLVSFSDAGSTTYEAALLGELVAQRGASWVVEASDHAFLFDGIGGPAGVARTDPLVRTYFERATAYAEPSDDLGLALTGLDPGVAWITRIAGIVPAREVGDDLAVTMTVNQPKSPFVVTSRAGSCSSSTEDAGPFVTGMAEGGGSTRDGGAGAPIGPPAYDAGVREAGTFVRPAPIPSGGGRPSSPVEPGGAAVPPSSSEAHGSMSCSCSPGADQGRSSSEDSCGHSDSTEGSSPEGCGGSPSDPPDEEDDGCGGSPSDSSDASDDGCDGSDPGDDPNDDGCDSSESRSSGETKCAVTRRTRRGRVRTSPVVFALAAVLLPLRRLTRPRPRRKGGTIAP